MATPSSNEGVVVTSKSSFITAIRRAEPPQAVYVSPVTTRIVTIPNSSLIKKNANQPQLVQAKLSQSGPQMTHYFGVKRPGNNNITIIGAPSSKAAKLELPTDVVISSQNFESLMKLLTCPHCTSRLGPPVRSCRHGIAWCETCKKFTKDHDAYYLVKPDNKFVKFSNKPNGTETDENLDNEPKHCTETFDNDIFNQAIQFIPLICSHHKEGCQIKMLLKDFREHEKICDYRSVNCFICNVPTIFAKFNEHLSLHEIPNHRYKYLDDITIEVTPQHPTEGVKYFYIENAQKYFLFVYSFYGLLKLGKTGPLAYSHLKFSVQYVGKEDFNSYLYTAKIFQGLGSFYTRSAKCTPFEDSSGELYFQMSDLFLTDYYLNGFKIVFQIRPYAP